MKVSEQGADETNGLICNVWLEETKHLLGSAVLEYHPYPAQPPCYACNFLYGRFVFLAFDEN